MKWNPAASSVQDLAKKLVIMFNKNIGTDNLTNNSVTKDIINADIVGGGLAQNVNGSLEVAANGINNARLANMATNTIKGRITAETGDPEDLSVAQVLSMLGLSSAGMAKAWVNFNGTANDNLTGTYARSGTTITVTCDNHGHIVGHKVYADFTSGAAVDGLFTITSVNEDSFTFEHGSSGTTSGNVTLVRCAIQSNYNVQSVIDSGVGNFSANYSVLMADDDYSFSITGGSSSGTLVNGSVNTPLSVAYMQFQILLANGSAFIDPARCSVIIFGN